MKRYHQNKKNNNTGVSGKQLSAKQVIYDYSPAYSDYNFPLNDKDYSFFDGICNTVVQSMFYPDQPYRRSDFYTFNLKSISKKKFFESNFSYYQRTFTSQFEFTDELIYDRTYNGLDNPIIYDSEKYKIGEIYLFGFFVIPIQANYSTDYCWGVISTSEFGSTINPYKNLYIDEINNAKITGYENGIGFSNIDRNINTYYAQGQKSEGYKIYPKIYGNNYPMDMCVYSGPDNGYIQMKCPVKYGPHYLFELVCQDYTQLGTPGLNTNPIEKPIEKYLFAQPLYNDYPLKKTFDTPAGPRTLEFKYVIILGG